ncbi:MAG: flippase-like domain-containing protein [Chloroflexi bacterium]|nr:flippase-like domain-containing protein [Chloroflexota bacterium]
MNSWRFWIGLLVSAVCLWLAFQGIRLDEVANAVSKMDYAALLPASVVFLVSYAGRVFRWRTLFSPDKLRLTKIFNALNIGYFLSNILPARIGDIVRAYWIGDVERVSKARALSTIVVERMSDGFTVVLLLGIVAFAVPEIPEIARQGALGVVVAGVAGIAFLVILLANKTRGIQLLKRIAAPFPFLARPSLWGALEALIDGFAILRAPRALLGVALWSIFAWTIGGGVYWITMRAVGIDLPLSAAYLVMTVTSLGVVVPSSPGYLGVFHAVAVGILTQVYHQDPALSLSYAIVVHAFVYLWLTALGLYSIWHEGLTYSRLQMLRAEPVKE